MREAHRLHKHVLTSTEQTPNYFLIGYIYTGSLDLGDFKTIQQQIVQALHQLKGLQE